MNAEWRSRSPRFVMHDAWAKKGLLAARMMLALGLLIGGLASWAAGGEGKAPAPPPKADKPAKPNEKGLSKGGPAPTEQRIQELIKQLGHDDYAVRQRAQEELSKFGFDAYDQLSAATNDPDLEIANRARYLLRLVRVQWTSENDPPAVKTILQDYEIQSTLVRARKIIMLTRLLKGAGMPAACRLVRFEKMALLSKLTAVEMMRREPAEAAARAQRHAVLRQHLAKSPQPAAVWLATYMRLREDPAAVLPEWTRLIEAEEALLRRSPDQSLPDFVAALIYQQAEIELQQGKTAAAEETARRAREHTTVSRRDRLGSHLNTASGLRERGLFPWAEAEYRYIIARGLSAEWGKAQIGLSEMFHDQGKPLAAAEARQELVQAMEKNRLRGNDVADLETTVDDIRARMNYMFACHWEAQGDREKQRKYLDDALQACPSELDTLIACYRLPDQTPEYRRKIAQLIERAAADLLSKAEDASDSAEEANDYNQYAWLVGNTEGDLAKAQQLCEKALEMSPDNAAYYDTLARVHYARGDLENAVKYQALAHEAEPHSGLIAKQYKLFQEALAKKKR